MIQRGHGWWWELMGWWDRITLHCWVSRCESSYQGKEGLAKDIRVNLGSQCTVSADVQSLSNGCTRSADSFESCTLLSWPRALHSGWWVGQKNTNQLPPAKTCQARHIPNWTYNPIFDANSTWQHTPSPTRLKHASPIFDTDPTPVYLM